MLRAFIACSVSALWLFGCSSASSPDADSAGNSSAGATAGAGAAAGTSGASRGGASAGGAGGAPGSAAGNSGASSAGENSAGSVGAGGAGAAGSAGASSSSAGAGGATAGSGGSAGSAGSSAGNAGSGACDWSPPPANVSAWIDESWNAQLGNNVKTRKDWNLDHVMLNKGQLNLCVRWGATTAVPATVRMNLESTIARWFNDWFKALGNYGCFPYGAGIQVKVTGWAVKPGKQSLLAGVDPAIPVYTETDGDGEPKCPDACSSFVHWDHVFSGCAGGAANHSDYWLWFDDTLPGGGGAAAVGGDWGLRMPVSTFVDHFSDTSFLICEHEMGHGFGFQDYYDWTGSKPTGGSLMIVGSTGGKQSPTVGDTWLLRRTWKEMAALRGW